MSVDHEHPVEAVLLYPNCGMCLSSGVYVFSIVLGTLTATLSIKIRYLQYNTVHLFQNTVFVRKNSLQVVWIFTIFLEFREHRFHFYVTQNDSCISEETVRIGIQR